jgi:flagellar biosynthesis protein FlhF
VDPNGNVHVSRASAPPMQMSQAQQAQAASRAVAGGAPARKMTATRYIDIEDDGQGAQRPAPVGTRGMTVEEELRHLKRMIEELKTEQEQTIATGAGAVAVSPGAFATPALQDAFEQLCLNGIDKRYALHLIKQVGFELGADKAQDPEAVIDQLLAEIMITTKVLSPLASIQARAAAPQPGTHAGPAIIALVGPTGVGKTTTVAKLASDALLRRNLKVGLINLDCYKVAAFDQLSTYGKILNIPFRSAQSLDDLKSAIADFQSLDVILVDTTGRSQRDPSSLKEMQSLLEGIPNLTTQLVLSATTRDNELYDMANRFAVFQPRGIIISKLDEATIYGSMYNVAQRVKLPLLYFTTGQRVPEDIEEATRERVASLIMDI